MTCSQGDDLSRMRSEQWVGTYHKSAGPLLDKHRKRAVEIVLAGYVRNQELKSEQASASRKVAHEWLSHDVVPVDKHSDRLGRRDHLNKQIEPLSRQRRCQEAHAGGIAAWTIFKACDESPNGWDRPPEQTRSV